MRRIEGIPDGRRGLQAMRGGSRGQGLGGRLGCPLLLACLLVLALLVAHQALMSVGRHAMTMAAPHERSAPASTAADLPTAHGSDGQWIPCGPAIMREGTVKLT